MCSKCLGEETNFKNLNRCYICRRRVKGVVEDGKLVEWMEISREIGMVIPREFGFIPREVH